MKLKLLKHYHIIYTCIMWLPPKEPDKLFLKKLCRYTKVGDYYTWLKFFFCSFYAVNPQICLLNLISLNDKHFTCDLLIIAQLSYKVINQMMIFTYPQINRCVESLLGYESSSAGVSFFILFSRRKKISAMCIKKVEIIPIFKNISWGPCRTRSTVKLTQKGNVFNFSSNLLIKC